MMIRVDTMNSFKVYSEDSHSSTGASMLVGGGYTWGQVYEKLSALGLVAVGGACPSVAMGGFTLGGGLSQHSRLLGTAADQVMSFEVVLANGRIVNVTNSGVLYLDNGEFEENDDMFWALRGGGGGTVGIVTHFHFQLHPINGLVSMFAMIPWYNDENEPVGEHIIQIWTDFVVNGLPKEWGGGIVIMNDDTVRKVLFDMVYIGNNGIDGAKRLIDDLLKSLEPFEVSPVFKNHSDQWDFYKSRPNIVPARNTVYSRMIPKENIENGKLKARISNVYNDHIKNSTPVIVLVLAFGGRISEIDVKATSVNPVIRSGEIEASALMSYNNASRDEEHDLLMKQIGEQISPLGEGTYTNGPDLLGVDKDWKKKYWGANYKRLVDIKQRYDPDNFFKCKYCVGSDLKFEKFQTSSSTIEQAVTLTVMCGIVSLQFYI